MTRLRARIVLGTLAAAFCLALTPAVAAAYPNTPTGALNDCGANDPLVGHYSVKVLQTALHDLTGSAADYSTCKDALEAALRAALLPHPKPKKPTPGTTTQPGATTTPTQTTPANLAVKLMFLSTSTIGIATVTAPMRKIRALPRSQDITQAIRVAIAPTRSVRTFPPVGSLFQMSWLFVR